MRWLPALLVLVTAQAGLAQAIPMPEAGNLRLQTVSWREGEDVLLTILPSGSLTVMLEPSEVIERVTVADDTLLNVRVTPEGNALVLIPNGDIARTSLTVETAVRNYRFNVRTQESPLAALVVRFVEQERTSPEGRTSQPVGDQLWSYRFRGDAAVQPATIRDDAIRTFIEYAPNQALPAVFAIGPSGEEEVVNGYMRDGIYVIDRVYSELVFRIDRERATARRNADPDMQG
jgi:type IV secretion system protein VirB9